MVASGVAAAESVNLAAGLDCSGKQEMHHQRTLLGPWLETSLFAYPAGQYHLVG